MFYDVPNQILTSLAFINNQIGIMIYFRDFLASKSTAHDVITVDP